MKKVVYSITKVNKDEKLKGVGYLVEGNLLIPSTSSKGNAYICSLHYSVSLYLSNCYS